MFEIRRYSPDQAEAWNQFVAQSKNGTFLFDRRFMDYHADRFADHSLMVYRRGKLYALLPGNVADETFFSHQGLTYGGLIMNEHTTAAEVVQLFGMINDSLRAEGLRKVVYKPTPWIYHRQPSEEDLYALIEVCHPRLSRSLSSAISRETLNPWYRIRLNGARRASEAGVVIEETDDYLPFWQILEHNLRSRYGLAPVHSVDEIMLLHNRLPDHIRLFVAKYQAAYNEIPIQFAADAYDGIYILVAAAEKAGITSEMSAEEACDLLIAAIQEITVDGITGSMTWDETGAVTKTPMAATIVNGEYVFE